MYAFISSLIFALLSDPTDHGACDEGWLAYGQTCFYRSASEKLTWFEAEEKCTEAGGHLASCLTSKEIAFLALNAGAENTDSYFVGIDDM